MRVKYKTVTYFHIKTYLRRAKYNHGLIIFEFTFLRSSHTYGVVVEPRHIFSALQFRTRYSGGRNWQQNPYNSVICIWYLAAPKCVYLILNRWAGLWRLSLQKLHSGSFGLNSKSCVTPLTSCFRQLGLLPTLFRRSEHPLPQEQTVLSGLQDRKAMCWLSAVLWTWDHSVQLKGRGPTQTLRSQGCKVTSTLSVSIYHFRASTQSRMCSCNSDASRKIGEAERQTFPSLCQDAVT